MKRPLRIGTRGSPLALAQAHMVAAALCAVHDWDENQIQIVTVTTTGDMIQDRPLADIGGKALWTKELDHYLLDGRTDISVHSMKDVETIRPAELAITAMLPRASAEDRLIGAKSIDALPHRARVGTSSPRRGAQLLHRRPDLEIVPIRGNVETRLARLECGEIDATLLAAAGLDRLGMNEIGTAIDMLSAPAQGAIGIEARADMAEVHDIIAAINHEETHLCISAERKLLEGLGGNCHSPVAALATMEKGQIRLYAEILSCNGSERQEGTALFPSGDDMAPLALAQTMLKQASPALRALFAGEA
jgi:hydroxymethylbilane synthase